MSATSTPYRVVASDMDGTLLNSSNVITPHTQRVLYRLARERGVVFVFATGRHHLATGSAPRHLREYFAHAAATPALHDAAADNTLSLAAATVQSNDVGGGATSVTQREALGFYLISSNGARVHDPQGRLVLTHNLDADVVRVLYQDYALPYCGTPTQRSTPREQPRDACDGGAHDGGGVASVLVHTSAYTTEQWHITQLAEPLEKLRKRFGMTPIITPLCVDAHDGETPATSTDTNSDRDAATPCAVFPVEGVGKVCFRCTDRALLDRMEADIVRRFGDRVSVAFSAEFCLDVMRGGVSKSSALREVIEHLDRASLQSQPLTMGDVVAFGDGMNDAEMLQAVGKGCVMGNADVRLKAALPHLEVIGSNDDDAVARKLQELFDLPDDH